MMKRKILKIVIIFFVLSSIAHAGELLSEEGLNYYNEAVRAQKRGDSMMAFSLYQKSLILIGEGQANYRKCAYNNIAVMYAEQGDFETAAKLFSEALAIDPKYKEANINMGMLFAKRGDSQRALEFWARASDRAGGFFIENEKTPYDKEPGK